LSIAKEEKEEEVDDDDDDVEEEEKGERGGEGEELSFAPPWFALFIPRR